MPKGSRLLLIAIGGLAAVGAESVNYNGVDLVCGARGCREQLAEHDDQPANTQSADGAAAEEGDETPSVHDSAITDSPSADAPTEDETQREKDDLKAQQGMERWAFWMFMATTFGVGLIGWTLWETRRTARLADRTLSHTSFLGRMQVREARRTTKETRSIGEKQAQAYLICNTGAYRLRPLQRANSRTYMIACNVIVANKGQSPARNIDMTYECWIMAETAPGRAIGLTKFEGTTFCADVGPNDEETAIIESDALTDYDAQKIQSDYCYISISGEMLWRNEFGNPQRQKFNLASPKVFMMQAFRKEGHFDSSLTVPLKGVGRRNYNAL